MKKSMMGICLVVLSVMNVGLLLVPPARGGSCEFYDGGPCYPQGGNAIINEICSYECAAGNCYGLKNIENTNCQNCICYSTFSWRCVEDISWSYTSPFEVSRDCGALMN